MEICCFAAQIRRGKRFNQRFPKKKGRASKKKTTWVKIKAVKGSGQKDKTDSETEPPADQNSTSPVTPKPEEPTPPPTETPIPDETLPPPDSETPPPSVTPEPGGAKQGKSLIVYFSCTDTTKKIAEYMQEITGADIYRIELEVPYTAEDLDYGDASARATREQNDSSARPAIAGKVENISRYQNVVIAYPIWWGQAPRIISTFLESYDFSGKTIVPVCTSHSSGIGSSAINLHELTDGKVTWLEGRRFSSTSSKEEVAQWLKDSGIQELLVQNKAEAMEWVFDFETKTVVLNSGYPMSLNGIGTYSLLGNTCVTSVSEALKRSTIAKAHGESSAQVILRWNLQKGVVVIPGSSNPVHIQENTELYDFELSEEEMRQINALDRNEKHDWY